MRRNAPLARAFVGALALSLAACDVPRFPGPQIQEPPPAFTMNPQLRQDRPMFPDVAATHHDAWVEASGGNFSGIYITGHPGPLGRADVERAREAAMRAAAGERATFGEVETLTVDGRTAHGWGEEWRLANGGLQYVVFRAAVPYDTVTYAIDFITGDPGLKIRPDSLRTVVASFAVGEVRANVPLLLVSAGLTLLILRRFLAGRREAAARARTIPLAKLPPRPPASGSPPQTPG